MLFIFGAVDATRIGDTVVLLMAVFGFTYFILLGASLVVTSVLYVILRLLPSKMTSKVAFEPNDFIVLQSAIFPLYAIAVFVATEPITRRDYQFKYYAIMYAIFLILFVVTYQLYAKRAAKKRALVK